MSRVHLCGYVTHMYQRCLAASAHDNRSLSSYSLNAKEVQHTCLAPTIGFYKFRNVRQLTGRFPCIFWRVVRTHRNLCSKLVMLIVPTTLSFIWPSGTLLFVFYFLVRQYSEMKISISAKIIISTSLLMNQVGVREVFY